MIEVFQRLYVGLFAAAIFSSIPATFCLLLSVKVLHSRRTGVWAGNWAVAVVGLVPRIPTASRRWSESRPSWPWRLESSPH